MFVQRTFFMPTIWLV